MHPPKTNDSQEMLTLLRSHLYDVNNAGEPCSETFKKMRSSLRAAGMCIARIIDPEIKQMAFDYYKEHDPISNGTASKDLAWYVLGSTTLSSDALRVIMWRSGALKRDTFSVDLSHISLLELVRPRWDKYNKNFLSILAEWNIANNFGYVGADNAKSSASRGLFHDTWDDYHDDLSCDRFIEKFKLLNKESRVAVYLGSGMRIDLISQFPDLSHYMQIHRAFLDGPNKFLIDALHKELHRLRGDL